MPKLTEANHGYYTSPTIDPITNTTETYRGLQAHYPHHGFYNWLIQSGLIMNDVAYSCAWTSGAALFLTPKRYFKVRVGAAVTLVLSMVFEFTGRVMAPISNFEKMKAFSPAEGEKLGLSPEQMLGWNQHVGSLNLLRQTVSDEIDHLGEVSDQTKIEYASRFWPQAFADIEAEDRQSVDSAQSAFKAVRLKLLEANCEIEQLTIETPSM